MLYYYVLRYYCSFKMNRLSRYKKNIKPRRREMYIAKKIRAKRIREKSECLQTHVNCLDVIVYYDFISKATDSFNGKNFQPCLSMPRGLHALICKLAKYTCWIGLFEQMSIITLIRCIVVNHVFLLVLHLANSSLSQQYGFSVFH